MQSSEFRLADGTRVTLNAVSDPLVARYLGRPKAFVAEMISQINQRNYYYGLFTGRKGMVFVDLGANLGLVSIHAAPVCRRVLAVEAEPATWSVLAAITRPWRVIECVNVAVTAKTGPVTLSIDQRDWTCHTATNPLPGHPTKTVPGLAFGDLINRYGLEDGIDLCKVDIEGSEIEAFSEDTIRQAPVRRWYMEVHRTPGRSRDKNVTQMRVRLEKCGFRVSQPRPNALVTSVK